MKKLLLAGMLLSIVAPLISMEVAPMTPSPEGLLQELKMLGIKMVYQARPLNINNANFLLRQAAEKIELIKQLGTKEQIAESKKRLMGMLRMYIRHLKTPASEFHNDLAPPPVLAPAPKKI